MQRLDVHLPESIYLGGSSPRPWEGERQLQQHSTSLGVVKPAGISTTWAELEGKLGAISQLLGSIPDRRATPWQVMTDKKEPLLERTVRKT